MLNVEFIWPHTQAGKRFLVISVNETTEQDKKDKIIII